MRKSIILLLVFIAAYSAIPVQLVLSQHPAFDNNPFFKRNDPSKYWENKNPHGGAGYGRGMELTPRKEFKSNFLFLHDISKMLIIGVQVPMFISHPASKRALAIEKPNPWSSPIPTTKAFFPFKSIFNIEFLK